MAKLNVALQMYTVRDYTKDDFVGTLKKVAEIGYRAVEFAGYGGLGASELRKVLDDLGIRGVSSHVGVDALMADLDGQIEYARTLGLSYIAIPWLPKERIVDEAQRAELAAFASKAGEACNAAGITLCYHNHDFEFAPVGEGYALDELFAATPASSLKAELDLYWVKRAGVNPADYLVKYSGRVPLAHLKDMADDAERSFAEVGYGTMDLDAIFAAGEKAGVQWYIVEQDVCKRPALESIQMSFEYLKSRGLV